MFQQSRQGNSGSESQHRCFFAIRFGEEVTSYLTAIIEQLKLHRADVRWIPARNIHLTLRFLGEITSRQLAQACDAGEEILAGGSLSLCARGLGAFPLLRAPRIFWAGVDGESREDMERLRHIQGITEEWARNLGLPPEHRRYAPHITLGRVARPSDGLKNLTDDIIGRECGSPYSKAGEIVLMRSRLASSGSSYEVLREWELAER